MRLRNARGREKRKLLYISFPFSARLRLHRDLNLLSRARQVAPKGPQSPAVVIPQAISNGAERVLQSGQTTCYTKMTRVSSADRP